MIKNFPDADDDDSLIVKKSFDRESKENENFEEFAAPFSQIEEQKDEPDEAVISEPEDKTEGERPFESLPPEIRKSNEDEFWKGKLEALKNDDFDDADDFQTENFQKNDVQNYVESPNETVNFTLPSRVAPVNSQSPAESETTDFQSPVAESRETIAGTFDEVNGANRKNDYPIFSNGAYQSETSDETVRKSGLAYAAAIVLFGSIVFTLVLGWFADLLLGTSPWGKVGGIILGAIIGFIQFFRTTSQILKDKD